MKEMKVDAMRFLRSSAARWCLLAVIGVAGSLIVTGAGERHYQLGGSWIGKSAAGDIWSCQQTPLDPAGRTMSVRVSQVATSDSFAGFLSFIGADAVSDDVGEGVMTSGDTCQFTMVNYAQKLGNPLKVVAIMVCSGNFTFTGHDTATLTYTIDIYDVKDDQNGDGLPDPGANPMVSLTDQGSLAKRVAAF